MKKTAVTLKNVQDVWDSITVSEGPAFVIFEGKMYKTGSKSLLKAVEEWKAKTLLS